MKAIVTVAMLLTWTCSGLAQAPRRLQIGQPAPDFELPGVDGKTYRLADFAQARLLLVVFTCNHCPTAQAYEDRLIKMYRDYQPRGVALVAISPNDPKAVRLDELGYTDLSDSFEEMKIRAKDRSFPFPYLYDGETQKTSAAYGVLATPHVFLFDQARTLRYAGRIDDSEVKTVKSHDARNALDALLAGKPVLAELTRVFGCSTKWADKQDGAAKSIQKWDAEPVKLAQLDEAGIKALVKNDTKNYRLINVWATWCAPCVQELPEFVTMNRMYRRRPFELITLSLDDAKKGADVLKVLTEKHVSSTNYLATLEDKDKLALALDKDWPGPLPHTILVAPGGKIVYRKTGGITPLELKKAIVDLIGRTY